MLIYIIGAVLCIVAIVWGLNQYTNQNEPDCRGCRYNNMGECDCPLLCERGEMWESVNNER